METEFIAQVRVTQQHFHLRSTARLEYAVRALPTDHMLGSFGHHHFVAHLIQVICLLVGVQQLGVPNGLSLYTEDTLQ